jgi:hypothetical protein
LRIADSERVYSDGASAAHVPQVIGGAQTGVFLKLTRGPAGVVVRQILLRVAAKTGGKQQGIGEDIQHSLSPFRLSMIAFAMKRPMLRLRKSSKL